MPGVLSFYDPAPPAPVETKNVGFQVIVKVAGGAEGDEVIVTLSVDGTKYSSEVAVIMGGVGYAYFDQVVLTRMPSSTLSASVEADAGFQGAPMPVTVVNP